MIDFVAAAASSLSISGGPSEIWVSIFHDFTSLDNPAVLAAFGQVLLIDLVLAGDNAIVVGALAAGLPTAQRRKVILIGIGAALVLRIIFALAVSFLMGIVGLILAGGLLLLWVAWNMWRELHAGSGARKSTRSVGQECVSTCRCGWVTGYKKKNNRK